MRRRGWLREQGYRYLVVSRERTRHFDAEAAVRIETASSHGVHLHKVLSDDAQEVRLYCFSEERAAKERGIVERFAKRFEDALTKLSEGLSKPRTHKRLDNVWQRIGRLKAQSRGVAQHYDIELDTDKSGQRATAVRFTRRPLSGSMMTHPGVYCLRSNETGWDEAKLRPTRAWFLYSAAVKRPSGNRCARDPACVARALTAESGTNRVGVTGSTRPAFVARLSRAPNSASSIFSFPVLPTQEIFQQACTARFGESVARAVELPRYRSSRKGKFVVSSSEHAVPDSARTLDGGTSEANTS